MSEHKAMHGEIYMLDAEPISMTHKRESLRGRRKVGVAVDGVLGGRALGSPVVLVSAAEWEQMGDMLHEARDAFDDSTGDYPKGLVAKEAWYLATNPSVPDDDMEPWT